MAANNSCSNSRNNTTQEIKVGDGPYSVKLSWERPLARENGTELNDLMGFNVYFEPETPCDKVKTKRVSLENETSIVLSGLKSTGYFFAVTAYDASFQESVLSLQIAAQVSN